MGKRDLWYNCKVAFATKKRKEESHEKRFSQETPDNRYNYIKSNSDCQGVRELISLDSSLKNKGKIYDHLATTTYYFDKFDENDLEKYLKSGKWKGSAGACKVEGFCKKYIKNVTGYESTAMGLTTEWVKKIYDIIAE